MGKLTPYARRRSDRRRKQARAWRETMAWLATHPGPSSYETLVEVQSARHELFMAHAASHAAGWEQVMRLAVTL